MEPEEIWREVCAIRSRLHELANAQSAMQAEVMHMFNRIEQHTEVLKGVGEDMQRVAVVETRFDDLVARIREDGSKTRWIIGVFVTIINLLVIVASKLFVG